MYTYVNRQSGANAFYFISYAFEINLRETKKEILRVGLKKTFKNIYSFNSIGID